MGRHGVVAFALDGTQIHEFELGLRRRERIGAIARLDNALFLSIYRTKPDEKIGMSPRVVRTSLDGKIAWSTMLPVDKVAYKGCVHMGVVTGWEVQQMPPWHPRSWLPFGSDQLLVSGSRLLASFQEMPRSGIGCRYVLDTESGHLIWKSQATPIAEALALDNGRFLIGDQGYGAFETHHYEDNAEPLRKWDSHGHYTALSDGRLICIEMSNNLSVPQHVVEFMADGTVRQLTQPLEGYYTSKPILSDDENLYFWRADRLWKWSDERGLQSLSSLGFGDGSFASSLFFSTGRFGLDVHGPYRASGNHRIFAVFEG